MKNFFLLVAAWVRSRAERPSVSYTKVTAKSQGQAISCKYTTKTVKFIQLRSLGISKTETQQETLKSDKN